MRKRLYRSSRDVMIAGVAAGMAKFFELDPTLVRLAWVLLLFAGPGLPLYLLAALLMPVEPAGGAAGAGGEPGAGGAAAAGTDTGPAEPGAVPADRDGARIFGWILIAIGALFLLERYTWFRWDHLWPVTLILLGVYLLVGRARDRR